MDRGQARFRRWLHAVGRGIAPSVRVKWRRASLVTPLLALLAGCSLSPAIQQNAVEYNAAAANYSDELLLYTLLRARDEAPLNMLALSTINGALSLQGSVGTTISYSGLRGGSATQGFGGVVTPSMLATSSPTFSMASLNTQGFTLGIIQPVSPVYIASKWSNGADREFLLRLFIKSIRMNEGGRYRDYFNNPSSPEEIAAFNAKLHGWIPHMTMRALTVLEPLGPPFDPAIDARVTATLSTPASGDATPASTTPVPSANPAATAMLGAYQHLLPLGTGAYRVGNAPPVSRPGVTTLQLYREFPQQVVLCIDRRALGDEALAVTTAPLVAESPTVANAQVAQALKSAALAGAGASGRAAAGGTAVAGSGTGPINGRAPGGVGSPPASLGTNLKVDRIAAIVPREVCTQDELVLPAMTEEKNARDSSTFSHVEWRSVAEVIQYLGAMLRTGTPDDARTWRESSRDGGDGALNVMFAASTAGEAGFVAIDYRGQRYAVNTDAARKPGAPRDHSLQAMALVSELISAAKVSSDIPTTQPIQLLP